MAKVEYVKCSKCPAHILKSAAKIVLGKPYCYSCSRNLL